MKFFNSEAKYSAGVSLALVFFFTILIGVQSRKVSRMEKERERFHVEETAIRLKSSRAQTLQREERQSEESSDSSLRTLADELTSFFIAERDRETNAYLDTPNKNSQEDQEQALRRMLQFQKLAPNEMVEVFHSITQADGVADIERTELARVLFKLMAQDSPEIGLEILLETHSSWLPHSRQSLIIPLIEGLARRDTEQAIQWLQQNRDELKGFEHFAKREVINIVAENSASDAFEVAKRIKYGTPLSRVSVLGGQARTIQQQLDLLHAIEQSGYPKPSISKLRRNAVESFSRTVVQQGFEAAMALVEGAKLSEEEKDVVAASLYSPPGSGSVSGGFSYSAGSPVMPNKDTQKWLVWLSENPTKVSRKKVLDLVGKWQVYDPTAAAEWLSHRPEGYLNSLSAQEDTRPSIYGQNFNFFDRKMR